MSNAWVQRIQRIKEGRMCLGLWADIFMKLAGSLPAWSHRLTVREPSLTNPFSATEHRYFVFSELLGGFKGVPMLLLRGSVS